MKKLIYITISILFITFFTLFFPCLQPSLAKAQNNEPMLAIIIDDFGSYDQSGVETMLSIDAPITCAIMPNVDNTTTNVEQAKKAGKEIIVHVPMEASVNLPQSWYGPTYISYKDSKEDVYNKLNQAFTSVDGASGFNIHIGSGVCQNLQIMNYVYDYAKEKNVFFVDSRTHLNTVCQQVAEQKNIVYLGRDEFLEPNGNRSYNGVKQHLLIGANLAKEKGFAIVIGHVGVHGGENTAKAIKDSVNEIKSMGVKIVPVSTLYKSINALNDQKNSNT